MLRKRLSAALVAVAMLVGLQVATAAPAAAAARILYYDASQAQEFVAVVNQGAQIWNSRVTNVQLQPVPAGRTPNIRVYADNGWPRTYTTSLGNWRWYMGRGGRPGPRPTSAAGGSPRRSTGSASASATPSRSWRPTFPRCTRRISACR